MELGHDYLYTRFLVGVVDVDRNAATVVLHRHRTVFVEGDENALAVPSHGLVDAVVDHFVYQMVKASDVGRADVHGRSFPYAG